MAQVMEDGVTAVALLFADEAMALAVFLFLHAQFVLAQSQLLEDTLEAGKMQDKQSHVQDDHCRMWKHTTKMLQRRVDILEKKLAEAQAHVGRGTKPDDIEVGSARSERHLMLRSKSEHQMTRGRDDGGERHPFRLGFSFLQSSDAYAHDGSWSGGGSWPFICCLCVCVS